MSQQRAQVALNWNGLEDKAFVLTSDAEGAIAAACFAGLKLAVAFVFWAAAAAAAAVAHDVVLDGIRLDVALFAATREAIGLRGTRRETQQVIGRAATFDVLLGIVGALIPMVTTAHVSDEITVDATWEYAALVQLPCQRQQVMKTFSR